MDDNRKMKIFTKIIAVISIIAGGVFLYMGTTTEGGRTQEALYVALGIMLVFNGFNMLQQTKNY